MDRCVLVRWTAVAALVVVGGTLASLAGPLDPPAGPVSPTGKTLTEVEPRIAINAANTPGDADSLFKITQSGSYYLTGNITGVVGKHGIEITTSNVTLDLKGFDLVGVPGSLDGVSVTVTGLTNIAVLNGSVRTWGDQGVNLAVISGLGLNCSVVNVRASGNAGTGIAAGFNSSVAGCSAIGNGGGGMAIGGGSTISHCTATNNTGVGISGLGTTTFTDCVAQSNTGDGLSVFPGSTVSSCTASFNTGNGINAGEGSTIIGCTARQNSANGILVAPACTVASCTAEFNTLDGINLSIRCSASGCTCSANNGDGIETSSSSTITGNNCSANGNATTLGAGVRVTGTKTVVDGNTLTSNRFGITVPGTTNLIVRNVCGANVNLNFDIGATNNYGPVIDRTAAFGPAVAGNSAPSSLGSTDPNANFAY